MEVDDVCRLDLEMEWKPGHVAAYLAEGDDGVVLIDAGVATAEGTEELRAELGDAGYGFGDLDAVLVTHPHLDHDGAVCVIAEESDATVYAYETVPEALRADENIESVRDNVREVGILGGAAEEATEEWLEGVRDNRKHLPPDEIDVFVSDGEIFKEAGETFEAVHTPGHQRDHVCYLCDGLMFSGDAIIESFRSVIFYSGFADGLWEAVGACYGTFDRLGSLAEETEKVYPGHGPVFEDLAGAVEGSTESLDALVEDVYGTVRQLDEPTAVDVTMVRKEPGQEARYVMFDNVGALGYLEQQGRIESQLDDGVRRFDVTEA